VSMDASELTRQISADITIGEQASDIAYGSMSVEEKMEAINALAEQFPDNSEVQGYSEMIAMEALAERSFAENADDR
jgi:hypothetical protein